MQPSLSSTRSPEHPFSHSTSGAKRKTDFRAKKASDFRRQARAAQFPEKLVVVCLVLGSRDQHLSVLDSCARREAVKLLLLLFVFLDLFADTTNLLKQEHSC